MCCNQKFILELIGFIWIVATPLSSSSCKLDKTMQKSHAISTLKLIEIITNLDDGYQSISSDNSQVLIKTSGIQTVVKMGLKIVPQLIAIMKTEDISFDTFIRCYSACDQILQKENAKIQILWYGGSRSKRLAGNCCRLIPGGQIDERKFRMEIIRDILKKVRSIHETEQ